MSLLERFKLFLEADLRRFLGRALSLRSGNEFWRHSASRKSSVIILTPPRKAFHLSRELALWQALPTAV